MSAPGRCLYQRLAIENFRNISRATWEPAPGFNLIAGSNGHGKTSLIEALYVLSTSHSFRSQKLGELISEGERSAQLLGHTQSFGLERTLRASISARGRSFTIDGKRPKTRLDYALSTPVIVFVPADLLLCSGPAQGRRTLLDRIIVYLDPPGAAARSAYQKAARARQLTLDKRGPHATELHAFEQVMAQSGARFAQARRRAAEALLSALLPSFSQMAAPELSAAFRYVPGGSEDPTEFSAELSARRLKDTARGSVSYGPSRDDLELLIAGRPARSHASQGQQRVLTIALKIAELNCVRTVTDSEPILLLDDVSSELDAQRTASVFQYLEQSQSQVFVTTTRPDLFQNVVPRRQLRADFEIENGQLKRVR